MPGLEITFTPDGIGHCLYTDDLDLRAIGLLSIRRATEIEFDAATQQWGVRLPGQWSVLFAHPSRTVCLAWERDNIQPDELVDAL